jgi:hypothetical protein
LRGKKRIKEKNKDKNISTSVLVLGPTLLGCRLLIALLAELSEQRLGLSGTRGLLV